MSWVLILLAAVLGLVFSALFSGTETGLYCASRLRLQLGARERKPAAIRLSRVLQDRQAAIGVTLVGTNLSNYITTTAVALLFADQFGLTETQTEVYTVAVLTPIMFVFAEVVPKTLFQRFADELLMRCSLPLAFAYGLLRVTGALWCHRQLIVIVTRLAGSDASGRAINDPRERMALLLQEALAGQTLGDDRSYLIDQVMQLAETPLNVIMVPRNHVVTIAAGADHRELARIARRTSHTWLPVYDAHPRHIIGLANVDGLLRSQEWQLVAEHIKPATTLSPHTTVASALGSMQDSGCSTAIVADRGGRLLGVVTLRDLLDAVLGELGS